MLVALGALGAWGFDRCEVEGASMLPALRPGDRLLLRRRRPTSTLPRGSVVAFRDPRPGQERLMVKRVASVDVDGVEVLGDNPVASTDSRTFGRIPLASIGWVVVRRYASADDVAHAR